MPPRMFVQWEGCFWSRLGFEHGGRNKILSVVSFVSRASQAGSLNLKSRSDAKSHHKKYQGLPPRPAWIAALWMDRRTACSPLSPPPGHRLLLTCRGFATSWPTVHFFSEKRSMPPIFPFLGAARSVRVPTSTVDSLTFLFVFSWWWRHELIARARISDTLLREA